MKRIINRKLYDTETATEIASASFGNPSDFKAWTETLYRAPQGSWFLAGKGGPMTRWRKEAGDGWCSGEGMEAKSEADVLDWVEQRGIDPDVITPHIKVDEA